ncbi:MAG TPA: xanthine dehydrogenase family protein molybdopterin-binding subunit [Solirubrobacteraceae bacterium]|jgi:carbon-monoxide dehydrogenase large subunit|nr:xanthine dehydrogenase family protein molybdopterin-binding subunit [Solirubrobacteraceae bacterium]
MANVIGQRVRRREDPRFLLGRGRFVDDLRSPGELHVTFVRSDWAHARIHGVDAEEARALRGVQVFTADDLDPPVYAPAPFLGIDERMARPPLARDKARFVGDIVAAVVAETREAAVDAAQMVIVDCEPLPAVTEMHDAARDETLLFEEVGTNVCLRHPPERVDARIFGDCDVVVAGSNESPRLLACPIEPRSTRAAFGEDGRLTIHLSTQTPHQDKAALAELLGLEPGQIRVIAPDVGGGFGGKGLDVEDVLLALLAGATGRPVRWTETRSEHMVAMHHGRAQWIDFEIGGSREGEVRALRLKILQDAGAYPSIGAFLATLTAMMSSGVYAIPKIEIDVTAVATNTTPVGPVRGAGRPEATQMLERAMDMFAAEIGMDPADIRRRNFIPAAASWPYTTASGTRYDIGDYPRALELVLDAADYAGLRRAQEQRRSEGAARQLGIGLSCYVEVTNGIAEAEFGAIEITAEGEAIVKTGSFSQGQGHETTFAQIVAEHTGLPVEKITVVKGDTDVVARGTGTYGSKSTQIGGVAARQASEILVDKAKRIAADHLEADPEDMVLNAATGRFHVAGAPSPALSWGELAAELSGAGRLAELAAETDFEPAQPTFPFGAHVAVVEVDTETGAVGLVRLVAVDDAGTIINPLVAEGQVHGGLAAGIAQALYEEMSYDEDGNPQQGNLVTYCFPAATELPNYEVVEMVTPTPINPLGAKGIGESGTIGATPAVHNAVIDALRPYGVRHLQMPVNGEKVWRAIQEGTTGG